MTIQDQYADTIRQTQEHWVNVVDAFSKSMPTPFGKQAKEFSYPDPSQAAYQAIDQVFDYWAKAVELQRDVAKQLIAGNVKLVDQVGAQAEMATSAVKGHARNIGEFAREQAETVKGAAEEQAEAVQDAVEEQSAARYESMNKADLQAELGRRDLPVTGNVDELRARLVEDDLKA